MILNPYRFGGGGPPVTPSTWDSAKMGPNIALSSGDLVARKNTNDTYSSVLTTLGKTSGKWYAEVLMQGASAAPYTLAGVALSTAVVNNFFAFTADGWGYYQQTGEKYNNNTAAAFGGGWTASATIGIAVDATLGRVWFALNNVWQASGDPASNANPAFTGLSGGIYVAAALRTSSIAAQEDQATLHAASGSLTYSPPSGFLAWG